jgi:hypothetical protein
MDVNDHEHADGGMLNRASEKKLLLASVTCQRPHCLAACVAASLSEASDYVGSALTEPALV